MCKKSRQIARSQNNHNKVALITLKMHGVDCKGVEKKLSSEDPFGLQNLDNYGSIAINLGINLAGLLPFIFIVLLVKAYVYHRRKERNESFSDWLSAQFDFTSVDVSDESYGVDVSNYLLFQRYLIYFSFVVAFVSTFVILPLNLLGTHLPGDISLFNHSTIINISENEWLVLFYNCVAFIVFLGLSTLMRAYDQDLPQNSAPDHRSRLMIDGVSTSCQEKHLNTYLSSIKGVVAVKNVEFFYYKEKRLDLVFVTLEDRKSAKAVMAAFEKRSTCLSSFTSPPTSSSSSEHLSPENWTVSWAPPANDIIEANLRFSRARFNARWIINVALFVIIIFFLSTPGHMLMHTKEWLTSLHLWIDNYMPTVLFSIFSNLLPLLVTLLNALIPSFYTKSDVSLCIVIFLIVSSSIVLISFLQEVRDVIIKKYLLLVMVTLIMPTLGFLDSRQLLQFITHPDENMQFLKLKCLFMADSGAFFIKYLIFSATISVGIEVLGLYGLVYQLIYSQTPDFSWDEGYVHYGLLFTIPVTFSLTCPLISIVGFFCLQAKHYSDRHNLFYLYNVPPYIGNQRIPKIMTGLILTPAILQQVFMLVFTYFTGHSWIFFISIFLLSCSFYLVGKFSYMQ